EETKQKLALTTKLRQYDSDIAALQEQIEESEVAKANLEKKLNECNLQIVELRKKLDEEGELFALCDENRKKLLKENELYQQRLAEANATADKFEKSKKKLQSEVEDLIVELENQRTKV